MRLALTAISLLAILTASACRKDPPATQRTSTTTTTEPAPPASGRVVGSACEMPLAAYCEDRPCPTHAEAYAALKALAQKPQEWARAEAGTCGELRYILRSVWYMADQAYFDTSGKLVGAERRVDNLGQYCGKSGWARYGAVPSCTPARSEVVLDGGAASPLGPVP